MFTKIAKLFVTKLLDHSDKLYDFKHYVITLVTSSGL
jgi:hypothetical protein